jgi:hypothetical protein
MDRFEQGVVLKFLFLKGPRYKASHMELSPLLGEQTCSLSQAKRWILASRATIFHVKTMISPGDRSRIFQTELNQNHFLATIARELSNENSNSKRKVDKKQIVHIDSSMCHNGRKFQEYFAGREMTRTSIQFIP